MRFSDYFRNAVFIAILICPLLSMGQIKSTWLGIGISHESYRPFKSGSLGVEFSYEKQLTKHVGLETGLKFRSYKNELLLTINNLLSQNFTVSERYISVPVLFKYYTRFIILSAGPSIDYFTSWKQITGNPTIIINSYSKDSKYALGFLVKASKKFSLNQRLILEPEMHYNRLFAANRTYWGIGLTAKYHF